MLGQSLPMTMAISKLGLTIVLILATASASVVLHAHASLHGLSSPHIKQHAGGGNNTTGGSRNDGLHFFLDVQMGPVYGEGEGRPETEIIFKLFEASGWDISQDALASELFKPGELVQLEMNGFGDHYSSAVVRRRQMKENSGINDGSLHWLLDPCRMVIKSVNGWRAYKAWYIHWVTVIYIDRGDDDEDEPEESRRTFVVNRWIGPEEFDSFLEIDNCSYPTPHDSLSASSPIKQQQLHDADEDGRNTTASGGSRNSDGITIDLDVQTGYVVGEEEGQPETSITFELFVAEGWQVLEKKYSSRVLEKGKVAHLKADVYITSDPCRLIIKSDDGWKAEKAWYIHWVRVPSGDDTTRTFVVNRWLGPEQFDSYLEIDNCDYGDAA